MYCGSNKTALESQKQIAEALMDLMRRERYGDISVSALCQRADISRQTFYSLFRSMDNVVTYTLRNDCCYHERETQNGFRRKPLREVCAGFSRYIIRHADILQLLCENQLMPLLGDVLREDFARCGQVSGCVRRELAPYSCRYLAAGITSIAETYIRQGRRENEAQLGEIIFGLLSGSGWE